MSSQYVAVLISVIIKLHNFCLSWGDDDGFSEQEAISGGDPSSVPISGKQTTVSSFLHLSNAGGGAGRQVQCARREELADLIEYGSNGIHSIEHD